MEGGSGGGSGGPGGFPEGIWERGRPRGTVGTLGGTPRAFPGTPGEYLELWSLLDYRGPFGTDDCSVCRSVEDANVVGTVGGEVHLLSDDGLTNVLTTAGSVCGDVYNAEFACRSVEDANVVGMEGGEVHLLRDDGLTNVLSSAGLLCGDVYNVEGALSVC